MDDDESPPRKRARMLSKACEMCKIKKSRCDSARPCSLCRQKGTKCEYREKGQPGLRPGYGKAMESRMAVLEDSMHKMSQNLEQVLQQLQQGKFPIAMSAIPQMPQMPQIAQAMSGSGSEHGSPGDDTPEDSTAGDSSMQPSISASGTNTANSNAALPGLPPPPIWQPATTPGGEWLSLSPAVAHKTAPEILASMASARPIPSAPPIGKMPTDTGSMIEPTTNLPSLPGLPPREVLYELIELFFDRIYPWAPLFYKPNFIRHLSTATFPDTTNTNDTTGNEKLLLLHGITVLCFRYWTKLTPSPEAREAFINASRDQVLLRTIDACSLVSTQALTLLAIDAVGQGPGPRTWNIMAMLVAAARQLILATRTPNRPRDEANTPFVNDEGDDEEGEEVEGGDTGGDEAHRRQSAPAGASTNKGAAADQSTIEAEEKRRLFWVIYSLDRFASIFHGQPGAIDTKTIRLLYPSSDEEWGRPSASPEWFQGTSDGSSGGQNGNVDASAGGGINFNYANLSGSNPNVNGGSSNSLGNLGNSSSNHANCSANLWHHYIDALTLVDRSHQLLIQPVNVSIPAHCQEWQSSFRRFDSVLTAWFDNLPAFVREGLPIPGQQSSSAISSAASATSASPAATLHTPSFSPVRAMIYASYLLIFVRMYMIASFPATTSAYLRPSLAARTRLRQVCHDLANLASMYQPHELQALGPIFVFIVWVGARSLVILWTRGGYSPDELCKAVHKSTSAASSSSSAACMLPPDLETILTSLRHMAVRWPCAQRYVDIIQMIIDTKNSPGGPPGIDIFNDPRRTSYVIQSRFKALANGRRASMSRAKSHDSAASPEGKVAAGHQQSQNQNHHQNRQQHSHFFSPFPQYGSNQQPYSSLRGSQHASSQPQSFSQSTQYPYHTNPEPMMSMPFSQSLDFFDIPLLDSYDFTGTLVGTGTFGTEMDSEWL